MGAEFDALTFLQVSIYPRCLELDRDAEET